MDLTAMMALMGAGQQVTGLGTTPQVGAPAPAYQPGQMAGGLLGNPSDDLARRLSELNQPKTNPVQDSMRQMPNNSVFTNAPQQVTSQPSVFNGAPMSQPESPMGFGDRVGGFMGNLNDNLSGPAGQLGLGVLGRIHPLAPYAGLLGMGMFGDNEVF